MRYLSLSQVLICRPSAVCFFDYEHHETVLCKLPVWVGTAVLAVLTPVRKCVSLPSKRLGNGNTGVVFLKSRD